MEPTTLVIAAVAALAVLMIAVGLASTGGAGAINVRLQRYASSVDDEAKAGGQQNLGEMIASNEALNSFNRAVEQRSFGANIARDIARADLRLKPSEFLLIWAGSTL